MLATIHRHLPATRYPDFRALWGGTASSHVALWTQLLANAWIVYELSGSSRWVGVSTFASMSPFLLSPFGGIVADRFERRILVRLTRIGVFFCTASLAVMAATGILEVWMVITMALAQGLIRAVEMPSDQALLANVVPAEHLSNAISLSTMTQHGSRVAGPLLSAPLLGTIGVEGAYAIAACFALLGFTSVRRVQTRSRGSVVSVAQVTSNLREGLSYVLHTPPVLSLFALVFAHCALTMSYESMLPGFAAERIEGHDIHAGEGASPGMSFTMMALGVGAGALFSTLWLALSGGRHRGPVLFGISIVSGLAPVLMALSTNLPAAVMSAMLMGSSQALFMAMTAVLVQEVIPDGIRGRILSIHLMSAGGVMAVANLVFGALADSVGAPVLFLVPGIVFVWIVAVTAVAGSHLRRVYRTGVVPA